MVAKSVPFARLATRHVERDETHEESCDVREHVGCVRHDCKAVSEETANNLCKHEQEAEQCAPQQFSLVARMLVWARSSLRSREQRPGISHLVDEEPEIRARACRHVFALENA